MYRHIRLDTNMPFYVGMSNVKNRANIRQKRNKRWYEITAITNYEIEIIIDDLSLKEAIEKEKEFISIYGREDLNEGTLVNMTDGGIGSKRHITSIETRKRQSLISKGKPKPWLIGKPITPIGSKLSEEHKSKLRKPKSKFTHSEKTKQRDEKKRKSILVYKLDGTFFKEYEGCGKAAKEMNLDCGGISKAANGILKQTGGYIFKYKDQK